VSLTRLSLISQGRTHLRQRRAALVGDRLIGGPPAMSQQGFLIFFIFFAVHKISRKGTSANPETAYPDRPQCAGLRYISFQLINGPAALNRPDFHSKPIYARKKNKRFARVGRAPREIKNER
jgi:hypothetical protein